MVLWDDQHETIEIYRNRSAVKPFAIKVNNSGVIDVANFGFGVDANNLTLGGQPEIGNFTYVLPEAGKPPMKIGSKIKMIVCTNL